MIRFKLKIKSLTILLCLATTIILRAQSLSSVPLQPSSAAVLLSRYICIPSESGYENKAADFLMQQCREKGLIVTQFTDSIGCSNFAASLYPLGLGKPNIVFLNHMDVVSAGDLSGWTHPPYEGYIGDGKVWGRGTLDNKGMAIIQLFAIERFADTAKLINLPYNITILCVSGEETGGSKGSAIVSKNFTEVFKPALVIGEGGSGMVGTGFLPKGKTFFGISIAEKGFLWLKLSCGIHGAGHAAIAGSDYANEHMIQGLARLVKKRQPVHMTKETKQMFKSIGKQVKGLRGFVVRHLNWMIMRPLLNRYVNRNPELEPLFCNTVTISGLGNQLANLNKNTQVATAFLDCRMLPGTSPANVLELINKKINDTLIHVEIVQESPKQFTTGPEYFYNYLIKAIQHSFRGSEVVPILLPASTDNSYFRASGCPVYGLNPMIMSQKQIQSIHNFDEFIDLEDIDKGIDVFENFLRLVLFPVTPG